MPHKPKLILLLLLPALGTAQFDKIVDRIGTRTGSSSGTSVPSETKSASGIKEALRVGTGKAVDLTGTTDGFFKNEAIKILLPEKVRGLEKGIRAAGMGPKLDEFELSMNRAAEKAAPAARTIFVDAVEQMTFDDARKVLTGGNTSATEYFKGKTSERLSTAFRPAVESAMAGTGVVKQYNQLTSGGFGALGGVSSMGNGLPGLGGLAGGGANGFNITDYVVGKTMDGLFYMLGQEEKKIRTNPAAQITPLLKEVFGHR